MQRCPECTVTVPVLTLDGWAAFLWMHCEDAEEKGNARCDGLGLMQVLCKPKP